MQDNTFSDFVHQQAMLGALQLNVSYRDMMQTIVDAYSFQENLERERKEQEIDNFIREFDSITEILLVEIAKFENPDYAQIAIAINKVVFGRHELGIRQNASNEQLNKLKDFEKILAYSLKNGLLKSQNDLLSHLQHVQK